MEEKTLTPEATEEATEEPCLPEATEVESVEAAEAEVEEKAETEVETPTVSVEFSWCPPVPEQVFIAGTFNEWNPYSHQLTCSETGEWRINLDLAPGTYEYRFRVDGEWTTDPACETKVKNCLGSYNSVMTVE
jgi:5'-AMP-activated protein kinase regulatory beta subunit